MKRLTATTVRGLITGAGLGGLLIPGLALATNGYQLTGLGSHEKSLGGAVTAAPRSAMTAISNPAGIGRIGSRVDFSMEVFSPERSTDFRALGGEKVTSDTDTYIIPSLGWAAPITEDRRLWFGGGFFGTSGLGVDYAVTDVMPNGQLMNGHTQWDGYSSIFFAQMTPVLSLRVNDRLTVGAGPVLARQQVALKQRFHDMPVGPGMVMDTNFDLSKASSALGAGVSLGLIYDLGTRWRLGATYQSKIHFEDLRYNLAAGDIHGQDSNGEFVDGEAGTWRLGLDYPQQASVGLAWAANNTLTLSADVKWLNWSDTMDELTVKGPNGSRFALDPGWDDQWVFAAGAEWVVNPERLTLRAGVNYAESPLDDEDVATNLLLPAVVERHVALGGTVRMVNGWDLGFHLKHALKNKQTQDGGPFDGVSVEMDQWSAGLNIGYAF
ncbi:OmpP1/FadL family transporter [Alkalilimnicola ehrlichii MLHE-1]|uniref:Membrane protein involved in aromatic hydrocarbon degradation n=1 Tax=Alkalilimnicola ehrlichii (strain ATCC BAA-1101 / DSM 17681 / MLHE-1) TaxID=187272 RepID=Q0A5P9_ALKEH|nr:outer membrane protein transport protein [Alkalilimnicola ehrlichii]ABI57838.1 membrane protein involved in aromatic hydrocarbon degradation [Alkalilimnicola ehrlichii MLHE-1]